MNKLLLCFKVNKCYFTGIYCESIHFNLQSYLLLRQCRCYIALIASRRLRVKQKEIKAQETLFFVNFQAVFLYSFVCGV